MKKIETSTNLIPLVSVSTYGGVCDSDNLIDSYSIDDDFKEGYIPYNSEMYWDKGFNNELFMNDIIRVAKSYISDIFEEIKELNLGIKSIKVIDIHSPKYYNFETDTLNFDLIVNNGFHKNLLKIISKLTFEQKESLGKYLKDNFSSYDGFHSYTSNNLADLIINISGEEVRETSVFLYWYFKEFGSYELKDLLTSDNWASFLYENIKMYSEFVNDDFINECESNDIDTTKYVYEHYMNKDAETIINELVEKINEETDTFDNNELRIDRVYKTVNNLFKSIEANTLDLFGK